MGLMTVSKAGKSNYQLVVERSNKLGYYVLRFVMSAHAYGVPQHRDRNYVVGILVSEQLVVPQF